MTNVPKSRLRIRTTIVKALCVLSVLLWFGACGLSSFYDATRPHEPDIASGHVIAQVNHGSIVYLTAGEQLAFGVLVGSALAGLGLAAVLMNIWRLRDSRVEFGPNAQAGHLVEVTDYDAIRATYQKEVEHATGPNTSLERTRDR